MKHLPSLQERLQLLEPLLIMMLPTVASITAATAAEGKPCSVQLYTEQPSAVDTTHTFVID
jgi:hypothetical protein